MGQGGKNRTASRRSLSLDELPRYSAWPARLLGAESFAAHHRTSDEVLREYDKEKWGSVLSWLKTHSDVTVDDLWRQQGLEPGEMVPFALASRIAIAPLRVVLNAYARLLLDTLKPHKAKALVELGSGLGDNLLKLASVLQPRAAYGGEFTSSGVECGRTLAKLWSTEARFDHFDYNNPQTLETVPKQALVYTSHSIEQIPQLHESFVESLIRRSPQLVVHFEPCYQDHDGQSLIGLMRRRYTELNDYNRNLVELLRSFEDAGAIRILEHQANVFSDTPFNPTSIVMWAPR